MTTHTITEAAIIDLQKGKERGRRFSERLVELGRHRELP